MIYGHHHHQQFSTIITIFISFDIKINSTVIKIINIRRISGPVLIYGHHQHQHGQQHYREHNYDAEVSEIIIMLICRWKVDFSLTGLFFIWKIQFKYENDSKHFAKKNSNPLKCTIFQWSLKGTLLIVFAKIKMNCQMEKESVFEIAVFNFYN